MSKNFLIAFCLVAFVSAGSLSGPDMESANNYNELELFLSGFLESYTGAPYNMTGCLSPSTQDYLNELLSSTYIYMFTNQIDKIEQAYIEYLSTLSKACEECGLITVSESLQAGLSQKGKIWFEVNLAFNFDKLEPAFTQTKTQLSKGQWAKAGSTLGALTSLLIPYTPSAPLHSSLSITINDYKNWWKGLVSTLSITTKRQGPCATFLLNFANSSATPLIDINKIMNDDMSGFNTLFGDLAQFLTSLESYNGACMFDLLWYNIQDLATKDGLVELASRYAARALTINAAVDSIKNCDLNAFTCGQGFGTIIKYMLEWSIN